MRSRAAPEGGAPRAGSGAALAESGAGRAESGAGRAAAGVPRAEAGAPGAERGGRRVLRAVAAGVIRLLTGERHDTVTLSELRALIASSAGLPAEQRRLINEVLAAGSRHVREVMVPRTDVVFLEAALPLAEAVRTARSAPYSRFPVVDGSTDDVIGFVHLRDLLLAAGPLLADGAPATVARLAREVKRLPGSIRLLAALSDMRREGAHLAVVVDEYGGTAGIVTLEDLLEELVGEIHDEYDPVPEPPLADGAVPTEVDGRLNLADFAECAGFELPAGPYETVGGFLMARLGRVPAAGDEVRVDAYRLVVRVLDGRRVARVALLPAAASPAAAPRVSSR